MLRAFCHPLLGHEPATRQRSSSISQHWDSISQHWNSIRQHWDSTGTALEQHSIALEHHSIALEHHSTALEQHSTASRYQQRSRESQAPQSQHNENTEIVPNYVCVWIQEENPTHLRCGAIQEACPRGDLFAESCDMKLSLAPES